MGDKLLGDGILIDGSEIDILVAFDYAHLNAIRILGGEKAYVIQEKLEKVPGARKQQGDFGLLYVVDRQGYAGIFQPEETVLVPFKLCILVKTLQNKALVFCIEFRRYQIEDFFYVQLIFRVIFGYVLFVHPDDFFLYAKHILQVIAVNVLTHGGRHASDNKIETEKLHHLFMYEIIDRLLFRPGCPQQPYHFVIYPHAGYKFLEIQRIHFFYAHIPDRDGTDIPEFDAEHRTAENVTIGSFFYKELDCRDDIRAFLYFIEENQGLALDHRSGSNSRKTSQYVITAHHVLEQAYGIRIFDEVDLDKTLESLAEFPDRMRLADLAGAGNQQRIVGLFVVVS